MFIDPSKATPKDTIYTFEMAQDEIAKASGIISNDSKANMTQGFCFSLYIFFWFEIYKIRKLIFRTNTMPS